MVITATNRFITEPIVKRFGIDTILATEAERVNGKYTGGIFGIPCYKDGKVARLNQWLDKNDENMEGSYFYSDSANDLPLLRCASYPHAVDPDDRLKAYAEQHNWPVISLR